MSGMDLLVVIVFLLLGYWITSAVMEWLSAARAKRAGQASPAEDSAGGDSSGDRESKH